MSYYVSANDDVYSDDLLDKIGYAVGLVLALIGLVVIIVSILNMAPESESLLGLDSGILGYNTFMPGIGLIIYGLVIFFSGTMGVPISLPLGVILFTNHKFIRIFEILLGVFIILLSFFGAIMIIFSWI